LLRNSGRGVRPVDQAGVPVGGLVTHERALGRDQPRSPVRVLLVETTTQKLVQVRLDQGSGESNKVLNVFIPRVDPTPSDTNLHFILKLRQFPIILALSIHTNKSLGQTFNELGVFLPQPLFTHRQPM
jgi:ATP-dependent DNA helicase PIF1